MEIALIVSAFIVGGLLYAAIRKLKIEPQVNTETKIYVTGAKEVKAENIDKLYASAIQVDAPNENANISIAGSTVYAPDVKLVRQPRKVTP